MRQSPAVVAELHVPGEENKMAAQQPSATSASRDDATHLSEIATRFAEALKQHLGDCLVSVVLY